MKVYLNAITGIDDAIVSMYMSKHTWTRKLELEIRDLCREVLNSDGSLKEEWEDMNGYFQEFHDKFGKLIKWGCQHITMLRFIDFSFTVKGMHRAGQDDWDSHAKRFDNRIIRNSTRVKGLDYGNRMSEYYQGKIISTDLAAQVLNVDFPESIEYCGKTYVKTTNGYIIKEEKDNPDVIRGLYMLGNPSDFIFKINLTEWAHVYKMRNIKTNAHPEVKELCEMIANLLEYAHKELNRDLFEKIDN